MLNCFTESNTQLFGNSSTIHEGKWFKLCLVIIRPADVMVMNFNNILLWNFEVNTNGSYKKGTI